MVFAYKQIAVKDCSLLVFCARMLAASLAPVLVRLLLAFFFNFYILKNKISKIYAE
jgi:hypothetical protein